MTPKKSPSGTAAGPYILELDEALLNEAVAAVEQHTSKRLRPAKELPTRGFRPPSAQRPPEPEVEIEIPVSGPAPDASEREEESTEEPGLDLGKMAVEWDKLVAELGQVRMERDAARRQAETEARERARVAQRVKRLTEQLEQAQDAIHRAEEARRNAEQETGKARDEVRTSLEGVTRMRDRLRRAEEEQKTFGHAPVILGLLPVIENLERAANHAESTPERVSEGLKMILDQLNTALAKVGVQRVDASTGVPFQPAHHEAVIHVPLAGVTPGTVAAELQPGYTLHGRLIRPARVSVAAPAPVEPTPRKARGAAEDEILALSDDVSVLPTDGGPGSLEDDQDERERDSN